MIINKIDKDQIAININSSYKIIGQFTETFTDICLRYSSHLTFSSR